VFHVDTSLSGFIKLYRGGSLSMPIHFDKYTALFAELSQPFRLKLPNWNRKEAVFGMSKRLNIIGTSPRATPCFRGVLPLLGVYHAE